MKKLLAIPVLLLCSIALVHGGDILIQWDPVEDIPGDGVVVQGYMIGWGVSPDTSSWDTTTIPAAETTYLIRTDSDCQDFYVGVFTVGTVDGNPDQSDVSNIIQGWPRPSVDFIEGSGPVVAGQTHTFTLRGNNLLAPIAVAVEQAGYEGITTESATVLSCTEARVELDIPSDTPAGAINLVVTVGPDQDPGAPGDQRLYGVSSSTVVIIKMVIQPPEISRGDLR